ncbi:IPT/TIG domain-containing protein [Paractinoplanes maris]|uniref:IPT/TIG domain-containing protein n=1 Tax=Paractinoplanes maris TaxID=1734446 RepID=UPI002021A562|nr:IPT/TIG domain-containing protein [Actinoplanes maris]
MSKLVRGGLATFAVSAVVLTGTAVAAGAAPPTMTLSSANGPSGGGNSITATVTAANLNPFPAGTTPTVQFQFTGKGVTACAATAKADANIEATGAATTAGVLTVNPEDVKRVASNKIAFRVPSGPYPADAEINTTGLVLAGTQTTAKWNVCVYDDPSTTTSTLLATAAYTLAVRPRIAKIIPASSPSSGGQLITVTGVGFGAANTTTASIGGATLTGIKVAINGNSFTAVTSSRSAAANLTLTVNTPGGTVISSDPDNNGLEQDAEADTADEPLFFTYRNAVAVTPDTAPAGSKVDVSLKGVGFQSLTFKESAAPTDTTAHVFLVKDAYVPGSNRGVQECKKVMVVSNTELICTFDLLGTRLNPGDGTAADGPVPEGTYTVTVVANGATDAGELASPTALSSGATFTVGPF